MIRLTGFCLLFCLCAAPVMAQEEEEDLTGQVPDQEDSPLPELNGTESASSVAVRSRLTQRLRPTAGQQDGRYPGSALHSYHRIRASAGRHVSGGVLIEKDPGERRVADFISANVCAAGIGPFAKLILGDFLVESGQGLALWRPIDAPKGAAIGAGLDRRREGVRPYLSSGEDAYLSGIAAAFEFPATRVDLFHSARRRAAAIDEHDIAGGFYTAGLYRTDAEERKRHSVTERLTGLSARLMPVTGSSVGVTLYRSSFSRSMQVLSGASRILVTSVDFRLESEGWSLFGEVVRSGEKPGGVGGFMIRPSTSLSQNLPKRLWKSLQIVAAVRWYADGLVPLHGLGFGERSGSGNEYGMYTGVRLRLSEGLLVSAYADQYRFPAAGGLSRFSSGGNERFVQVDFKRARLGLTLRYLRKMSVADELLGDRNGFLTRNSVSGLRQRIRLQMDLETASTARFRFRCERLFLSASPVRTQEVGALLLFDIRTRIKRSLRADVRVSFFNTGSFETAMYQLENDFDGFHSMPPLYGRGVRWYLLLTWKVSPSLSIAAKYSDTRRDDVRRIGTGADRLPSNHDDRVGIQIDVSW